MALALRVEIVERLHRIVKKRLDTVSSWLRQTYRSGNLVGLGYLSLEDGHEGGLRLFLAFFCQFAKRVS